MRQNTLAAGLAGSLIGAGIAAAAKGKSSKATGVAAGAATGALLGVAVEAIRKVPGAVKTLEDLMPKLQVAYSSSQVMKPIPRELFLDRGTGTDYETRAAVFGDFITPIEHFYLRSHAPTPKIDVVSWRLRIDGTGVRRSLELTYDDLASMPQVTLTRTLECAGNGRRYYKESFGVEGEGGQWRFGAIGNAEWTGVRLRDVLELAGLTASARDVMPIGLDEHEVSWPMPVEKALRDDTLIVLKMNRETLPPDHGFPVRVLVSGWVGTASIKWLGRVQVSEEPLHTPYNSTEYILIGPHYPMEWPALGQPITEMPVVSLLDLDWPATVSPKMKTLRGRSFAGEGRIRSVSVKVDEEPWQTAELVGPEIEGCWRQWRIDWTPATGKHEVRVRATDESGRTQPESVPWNHHGYLYNAIVAHPITVEEI